MNISQYVNIKFYLLLFAHVTSFTWHPPHTHLEGNQSTKTVRVLRPEDSETYPDFARPEEASDGNVLGQRPQSKTTCHQPVHKDRLSV